MAWCEVHGDQYVPAQIEYTDCEEMTCSTVTPKYREMLHALLDEWLDLAHGEGHFSVGDPLADWDSEDLYMEAQRRAALSSDLTVGSDDNV
jgi:hypothetical protein